MGTGVGLSVDSRSRIKVFCSWESQSGMLEIDIMEGYSYGYIVYDSAFQ